MLLRVYPNVSYNPKNKTPNHLFRLIRSYVYEEQHDQYTEGFTIRGIWRHIPHDAYTQEALAKAAGIKQATVSRLLTGRMGQPGAWEKLLNALGLELVAVPKGTDMSKLTEEKGR